MFCDKRRWWTVQKSVISFPLCLNTEKEGYGGEGDNLIASCTNCPVCLQHHKVEEIKIMWWHALFLWDQDNSVLHLLLK